MGGNRRIEVWEDRGRENWDVGASLVLARNLEKLKFPGICEGDPS